MLFIGGTTLATGLMLPPPLNNSSEVERVAAAMFTLSYTVALIRSVESGAVLNLLEHPRLAFPVPAVCAPPLIVTTPTLNFAQKY